MYNDSRVMSPRRGEMKIMTIRVPKDVQEKYKALAKSAGVTRNALVLSVLKNYLKENKDALQR